MDWFLRETWHRKAPRDSLMGKSRWSPVKIFPSFWSTGPRIRQLQNLCGCLATAWSKCCSPPARWGLLDFIRVVLLLRLLRQVLLDHVCINFHLHFRLANSSPSSSPTSQLSAHCWTSTWDLPNSVRTAGPQPGTFPAQYAPLDLNLGPSQLSAHRWTSTAR